jgi:hypothetical protein
MVHTLKSTQTKKKCHYLLKDILWAGIENTAVGCAAIISGRFSETIVRWHACN